MNNKLNGIIKQTYRFLNHELWDLEPSSLSKVRAFGLKFLRVCALVIKGFREDNCPLHASALTFHFVMALIPTLVIAFSFAKAFGMEALDKKVLELIQTPAIEQSINMPLQDPAVQTETPLEGNPFGYYIINTMQQMPDGLKEGLVKVLETVEGASAGAMGGVGAILFLCIMLKMLNQIEETFNSVWGVQSSRCISDKIRNYVFIMAVTPVLLIVGTTAGPMLLAVAAKLEWVLGPLSKLLALIIPSLMMASAFSVFYVFLPNTRVRFWSAFVGALISALLVVVLQQAMIQLGFGVSKYNKIYGALAAIPIFLFWVQMSWMILLMGAEVAFSVQNAGTYIQERLAVNPSPRSRLYLAFEIMKRIAKTFEEGGGVFDTHRYGVEQHIPVRLINDVSNTLAEAQLITETADCQGCYTLLRNPGNISARCIADAILNDGADPSVMRVNTPVFNKMTEEGFQAFEKQTLTML